MPNNDKIQALYNVASKNYNVGTLDEFTTKLADPNKRKALYETLSQDYDIGDYNTFNMKLGFDSPEVKKQYTQQDYPTFNEDNQVKQLRELQQKANTPNEPDMVISSSSMGVPVITNFDKGIYDKQKVAQAGYDEGLQSYADLIGAKPEDLKQVMNDAPYLNSAEKIKGLVDLKTDNIYAYNRLLPIQNIVYSLASKAGTHTANEFNALQEANSLEQGINNTLYQQQIINKHFTGDERDKLQADLLKNKAPLFNASNPELLADYNNSELKNVVDPLQYSALKLEQVFNPGKYNSDVAMLTTQQKPEYELTTDASNSNNGLLFGRTHETETANSINRRKGREALLQNLAETGRQNTMAYLDEQLHDLDVKYKQASTPEEKNALVEQYNQLQTYANGIDADRKKDDEKYPLLAQLKFDNQVKELTQDAGINPLEYGFYRFSKNISNTGASLENIATRIFGGKEANSQLQLQRLGEAKEDESTGYMPESLKPHNSEIVPSFNKELQTQANNIISNKYLPDDIKQQQLSKLMQNNQDKIDYVTNPDAGKDKNFWSKATLYGNAGMIGDILGFAAQQYTTGGLGKLTSVALPMYLGAQNDYYKQAIEEGNPNPQSYANTHASIMALAGLINPDINIVKRTLGMNSVAGKFVAGLDEKTWNEAVNKNTPLVDKFKNSALSVAKEAGKMAAVYGAGTSIASDVANNLLFNKNKSAGDIVDDAVKASKELALNSVALFGVNAITNFKSVSPAQKAAVWELGVNPDITKQQINEAVKNGDITQAQADQRKKVVDDVSNLIQQVPVANARGELLTDRQKADYLYNQLIKGKADEIKRTMPEQQQIKIDDAAKQADEANNAIIENIKPEDSQPVASIGESPVPDSNKPAGQTPHPVEDEIKIGEMLDKPITYEGKRAYLYQDGQTVVAKIEGQNREYELGNIDEVKNKPISDFNIQHETSVVNVNDAGDITVRDTPYKNNYSNPLAAINYDNDGNIVSINLETTDSKKRTFRGNVAEDIAYQIHLKEITKDNATRTEFENFINSDETAAKQINDAAVSGASEKGTVENNAKVQRTKAKQTKSVSPQTDERPQQQIPSGTKPEDNGSNVKTALQKAKQDKADEVLGSDKLKQLAEKHFAKNKPKQPLTEADNKQDFRDSHTAPTKGGYETIKKFTTAAEKVIKKLYPKAKVEAYDNEADYIKAGGNEDAKGLAIMDKNGEHRLLLNLEAIDTAEGARTVIHEAIHPIVYDKYGVHTDRIEKVWYDIANAMQDVNGMDNVFRHIAWYSENKHAPEGITELLTQLALGNIDISDVPVKKQGAIARALNKMFEALGIGFRIKNADDFKKFAQDIKVAFETGDAGNLQGHIKNKGIDKFIEERDKTGNNGLYDESELVRDKNGKVTGIKTGVEDTIRNEKEQIANDAKANGTWMKAPNGKNSNLNENQWVATRTKRFKDWFGDWEKYAESASKVVDENGEPLVVYHGTGTNIDAFDHKLAQDKEGRMYGVGTGRGVFSFTDEKVNAEIWAKRSKERRKYGVKYDNPNVVAAFLDLKNPITRSDFIERLNKKIKGNSIRERDRAIDELYKELKKDGVDGIVSDFGEYTALYPEQIKSATDNAGTFSKETSIIDYDLKADKRRRETGENKVGNTPIKDVYSDIKQNDITKENLQKIEAHAKDIEEGKSKYTRFSSREQAGLRAGGQNLIDVSLIVGRSDYAGEKKNGEKLEAPPQHSKEVRLSQRRLTDDEISEQQEADVRNYAIRKKIWHKNTETYLSGKYGEPFSSGKESKVWYDPERGVVIKSFDTFQQYTTLQKALDSITLHNTEFPETAIKVIGFGKNEDGNFSLVTEQKYIEPAKDGGVPTEAELNEFAKQHGFELNADRLGFDYKNQETNLHDLHDKNVIRGDDGKLYAIDTIMSLSKERKNVGDDVVSSERNGKNTPIIEADLKTDKLNDFIEDVKKSLPGITAKEIKDALPDEYSYLTEADITKILRRNAREESQFNKWVNYAKGQFISNQGKLPKEEFAEKFAERFNMDETDPAIEEIYNEGLKAYEAEGKRNLNELVVTPIEEEGVIKGKKYVGIIPAIRDYFTGNLNQLGQLSPEAKQAAVQYASSASQASMVIRKAVTAIADKYGAKTWIDLRKAVVQSRLDGIRERWQQMADAVNHTSDEDLMKGVKGNIGDVLDNIEAKSPLENLKQDAQTLVNNLDFDQLRQLLKESFEYAADHVANVDFSTGRSYDEIVNDPKFKGALDLYKSLVEKPIRDNHAGNEGIFSDALGKLDTYFPLIPMDVKGNVLSKTSPQLNKPINLANKFATGLSNAYDISVSKLNDQLVKAFKNNNKAAMVKALEDAGMIKTLSPYDSGSRNLAINGEVYKARTIPIGENTVKVVDGKKTVVPPSKVIIPDWLYKELKPMLESNYADKTMFGKVMDGITSFALGGIFEPAIHTANLVGGVVNGTPFPGTSLASKTIGNTPVTKIFTSIFNMMNEDVTSPKAIEHIQDMAKLGLISERTGHVTWNSETAEATGAKKVMPTNLSPFLYGKKGVDLKARVLMDRIALEVNPKATPEERRQFANQLGNYVFKLEGQLGRTVKANGISPFFTASSTFLKNGIKGWLGITPLPTSGLSLKDKMVNRAAQMFSAGAIGLTATWALAYKANTGKYPWQDDESRFMMIPLNDDELNYIDKHPFLQKVFYKNGQPQDINMGFFNRTLDRGARGLGLSAAYNTIQSDGTAGQVAEAMYKDQLNSFLAPVISSPAIHTFATMATGHTPYIIGLRDYMSGEPALEFARDVKTMDNGFKQFGANAAQGVMDINPLVGMIGDQMGLSFKPKWSSEDEESFNYMRMIMNLTMPNFVKPHINNDRQAYKLMQQQMKIEQAAAKEK